MASGPVPRKFDILKNGTSVSAATINPSLLLIGSLMKQLQQVIVLGLIAQLKAFRSLFLVRGAQNSGSHQHSWKSTQLGNVGQVVNYIKGKYPMFHNLILSKNDDVWKKVKENDIPGYTIFAPTDEALLSLGGKKLAQLDDARNAETAEKIAAFHCVNEAVAAQELFDSGGIITLGGDIPIGRSRTGGMFGLGGKEDGGVTVNGAKVLSTTTVDECTLHEVDALVSPEILWRYVDQLRIPGSK